jgi:RNA polymerase sigma-70 factor (ECF subfamily)
MDESKAASLHDLTSASDASGAVASFEEFFELERDRLFAILALAAGDRSDAEEIAQDAFVAVLERWDRVRLMDNPGGYLQRTAINIFRRRYARRRFLGRLIASLDGRATAPPADSALVLSETLRALAPRQRAALVLTELLGYTGEEAGKALGVKASTIAALKHQGRTALRRDAEPIDD